jgi:uncharacterized iron-regulated membrane protein
MVDAARLICQKARRASPQDSHEMFALASSFRGATTVFALAISAVGVLASAGAFAQQAQPAAPAPAAPTAPRPPQAQPAPQAQPQQRQPQGQRPAQQRQQQPVSVPTRIPPPALQRRA